jgi:hypothetical protein
VNLRNPAVSSSTPDPRSWKKEEVAAVAVRLTPSIDLPIRFFTLGLASLAFFAGALPFISDPVLSQHHYHHHTVALTHLLVLGWIASIILGATVQLIPVALGVRIHSEKLVRWTFVLHAVGVTGMVVSFWLWTFRPLLWFGSFTALGFSLFVYNIWRTLLRVSKHDAVSVHIAVSLVYLVLTFLAGQYLMHDKATPFSPFNVISAIHAHAHLAALGWFVMMIVGVSYRLVPMFALTTPQSNARIWTCFALLNLGILGVFIGILANAPWLPLAAVSVAAALGLWALEILAMLRARMRPHMDGTLRQVLIAMAHLPAIATLGIWLSWPASLTVLKAQAQTSYGLLALLGLVTLFIMAMLYKIIPFLVWYKIYPPLVGRQPVPRLYDLYSLRLQRWSLRLYLSGLWATAALTLFGERFLPALQISAAVLGGGILLFVLNMAMPLFRLLKSRVDPLSWLNDAQPPIRWTFS